MSPRARTPLTCFGRPYPLVHNSDDITPCCTSKKRMFYGWSPTMAFPTILAKLNQTLSDPTYKMKQCLISFYHPR